MLSADWERLNLSCNMLTISGRLHVLVDERVIFKKHLFWRHLEICQSETDLLLMFRAYVCPPHPSHVVKRWTTQGNCWLFLVFIPNPLSHCSSCLPPSRVKPAIFDLLLAVCIAAYLGMMYLAIQVSHCNAVGCSPSETCITLYKCVIFRGGCKRYLRIPMSLSTLWRPCHLGCCQW